MKRFILQTISYANNDIKGTRGSLFDKDLNYLCPTLELPFISNKANQSKGVSCIPQGIYRVIKDNDGKHQWWKLTHKLNEYVNTWEDIHREIGRSAIEIHPANWLKDLQGCIALGTTTGTDNGELTVWKSGDKFELLKDILGAEFILDIRRTIIGQLGV
jgi:hypothetical protein